MRLVRPEAGGWEAWKRDVKGGGQGVRLVRPENETGGMEEWKSS